MTEVPSSVLHKSRVRSIVPDIFLVYGLAVSIFMPFYFTVAAVLLVTAMVIFNKERRHRVLKTAADRRLIALLFIPFYIAAFHENLRGMMYAVLMITAAVCAFFLKNVMTRSLYNSILDVSCVCSIVCVCIGFVQKAEVWSTFPDFRPASVFTNANYFGAMTGLMVLVCVYRCLSNRTNKWFYMITAFCNLFGLYLCASMSSLAATLCGVFVMLVLAKKKRAVIAFLISAAFCGLLCLVFPELYPRLDAVDVTFGYRLSIWKASIKGFLEFPLFGRGAAAYPMICNEFGSFPSYHCHNIVLDVLLNFGIVGLIGCGLLLGFIVRQLYLRYRRNVCKNMSILAASALTAVMIHGITDVTIFWIQTGMFFIMIFSSMGIGAVDTVKKPLRSLGDLLMPSAGQKRRLSTEYFERYER